MFNGEAFILLTHTTVKQTKLKHSPLILSTRYSWFEVMSKYWITMFNVGIWGALTRAACLKLVILVSEMGKVQINGAIWIHSNLPSLKLSRFPYGIIHPIKSTITHGAFPFFCSFLLITCPSYISNNSVAHTTLRSISSGQLTYQLVHLSYMGGNWSIQWKRQVMEKVQISDREEGVGIEPQSIQRLLCWT